MSTALIDRLPGRRSLGAALVGLLLGACSNDVPPGADLAGMGDYRLAVARDEMFSRSTLGDFLAGSHALEAGQITEAADFFGRALQGDPDNLELLQQLFILTLASGRYDEALELADRLTEIDPGADEARLLEALEAARRGAFDEASANIASVGTDGIAALAVPFLDAWVIYGEGGAGASEAAVARLEAGEQIKPLNDFHRAVLLDLGGRLEQALEVLGAVMPEPGRSPPQMARAYASMQARAGDLEAARTLLEQSLAVGDDQPGLRAALAAIEAGEVPALPFDDPAGGIADALYGLAQALHQERGAARAIVYARLARFVQPAFAEAALLIGDILAEQENHAAAIEVYRSIEADSPLHHAAGLRTARALHAMEREDEAYDLLDELADMVPDRTDALIQLGDLLRRDEAYERSERAYSRAIERIDEIRPEHWTLFYARGITFERTDRWEQAEADFLEALELEPEQPFVLNYLGYSWVDMGMNLDRARGMLNRAVELRPNDGYIVDSLGWVHYRLGEYEDAVEQLERAVELEPGDPIINDHLGDAYWRVGREREARFQWQRALSLDPEPDDVAEIERKLESGLSESANALDRT